MKTISVLTRLLVWIFIVGIVSLFPSWVLAKYTVGIEQEVTKTRYTATKKYEAEPGWSNISYTYDNQTIEVTVKTDYNNPMLQVINDGSIVWEKMLRPQDVEAVSVVGIKNEQGRVFYILRVTGYIINHVGTRILREYTTMTCLVGRNLDGSSWKQYVNSKEYFNSLYKPVDTLSVRYGELLVRDYPFRSFKAYRLDYDRKSDSFKAVDIGKQEALGFNSELAYSPQYRPVDIWGNGEQYLDVNSIKTLYEDEETWVFTASGGTSIVGSDIIQKTSFGEFNTNLPSKYEINRVTKQAWKWSDKNQRWVLLGLSHGQGDDSTVHFMVANWASKIHYGFFLNPDNYAIRDYANYYKGPDNV